MEKNARVYPGATPEHVVEDDPDSQTKPSQVKTAGEKVSTSIERLDADFTKTTQAAFAPKAGSTPG